MGIMNESMAWLILLILFILIEIATLGLTTIWFAGGALFALIAALLGFDIWVQIALFFVLSVILLVFTRPVAVKFFNTKRVPTNSESLIGNRVKVTDCIDNLNNTGTVMINGLEWTARATDNRVIPKDAIVRIVRITGVKAIVEEQTPADYEKAAE